MQAQTYGHNSALGRMDEDVEAGNHGYGDISGSPTPSISRRSSYIYMNESQSNPHSREQTNESSSSSSTHFLPLPAMGGNGYTNGLGLTTPQGTQFPFGSNNPIRRISSTNLSSLSGNGIGSAVYGTNTNASSSQGQGLGAPIPVRRVTMPRMLSTYDWSAAAAKKDKSMLNYVVDQLPGGGGGGGNGAGSSSNQTGLAGLLGRCRSFARWLWKARNGVVAKSWREVIAIAWPAAIVWIIVNALFFVG